METTDKKKEILKAASECFARYGYDKTTLDDIGRLVGLNKASLYYYYKNKDAIFSEVILMEVDELLSSVLNEVCEVKGNTKEILVYLTERLKFIKHTTNLYKLSTESMQSMKPIFDGLYRQTMEKEVAFLSNILDYCIKNGEIIQCDSKRVAESILTVTEAIKNRQEAGGRCKFSTETSCNDVIDEVAFTVSLILDGLKRTNSIKGGN